MFNWKKVARSLLAFSLVVAMTLTGCGKPPDSLFNPYEADELVDALNSGVQSDHPENADKFILRPAKERPKDGIFYYESNYGMTLKVYTDKYKRVEQTRISYVPNYTKDEAGTKIYSTFGFIMGYLSMLLVREETMPAFKKELFELAEYYPLYFANSFTDPDFNHVIGFTAGKVTSRYVFTSAKHEYDLVEDTSDFVSFQESSRRFIEYADQLQAETSSETPSAESVIEPQAALQDSESPEATAPPADMPVYHDKNYVVGDTIPEGIYYAEAKGNLSALRIYSEYAEDHDDIPLVHSYVDTHAYFDLRSGRHIVADDLMLTPAQYAPSFSPDEEGYYKEGRYRVGVDISAGLYEVLPVVTESSSRGYWARLSGANDVASNVIESNNFNEPSQLAAASDEFLLLKDCRIKLVDANVTPAPISTPEVEVQEAAPTQEQEEEEETDSNSDLVYITSKGKSYHRENCATLKRSKNAFSTDRSSVGGRSACKVCKP